MAIELGKVGALVEGALNGKKLQEAWLNGKKIWPVYKARSYFVTVLNWYASANHYPYTMRLIVHGTGGILVDTGYQYIHNGQVLTRINLTNDYVTMITVATFSASFPTSHEVMPLLSAGTPWQEMQSPTNKLSGAFLNSTQPEKTFMSSCTVSDDDAWDQFTETDASVPNSVNIFVNPFTINEIQTSQYYIWNDMQSAPGFTQTTFS